MSEAIKTVADLNDKLRTTLTGGIVVLTRGVQSLDARNEVLTALRLFDAFDGDNDPYGEHDFGALCVNGHEIFWKIDYYDLSLTYHSPDKADPAVTTRVLTIMLAEEY